MPASNGQTAIEMMVRMEKKVKLLLVDSFFSCVLRNPSLGKARHVGKQVVADWVFLRQMCISFS